MVFFGALLLFQWSSRCWPFGLWFLYLFRFTYSWSLAWRILSITFLACEMSAVVWLELPFFRIGWIRLGWKPDTNLPKYLNHCLWGIETSVEEGFSSRKQIKYTLTRKETPIHQTILHHEQLPSHNKETNTSHTLPVFTTQRPHLFIHPPKSWLLIWVFPVNFLPSHISWEPSLLQVDRGLR